MNRKEAIIIVVVLLSTFIGGVFAAQNAPGIQQVFVTNFPKNQTVTVTQPTPTLKSTSTEIEALKFNGANILAFDSFAGAYAYASSGVVMGNLALTFAFAPNNGFQQVNSVRATILYEAGIGQVSCGTTCGFHYCVCGGQAGDRLLASMNGMFVSNTTIAGTLPTTTVLNMANLQTGVNTLTLTINNPTSPAGSYSVYEVRLTVSYTYLG